MYLTLILLFMSSAMQLAAVVIALILALGAGHKMFFLPPGILFFMCVRRGINIYFYVLAFDPTAPVATPEVVALVISSAWLWFVAWLYTYVNEKRKYPGDASS